MKNRILKIIGSSLALLLVGNYGAAADFTEGFAPSNWTFSGNATSNSLTSSQMRIVSSNTNSFTFKTASYSVTVPVGIDYLNFQYSYVTNDVNGSFFDMARYSVSGNSTDIVSINSNQGYSESGMLGVKVFGGQTFAIHQDARDDQLGSATLVISQFFASKVQSALSLDSLPILTQSGTGLTCSPGTYTYLNGGATKQAANLSSVTYTLEVDGVEVSRAMAGTSALPSMLASLKNAYSATATLTGATFDMAGKTNFNASCKVLVTQGSTVLSASSATIADTASIAVAKAKAAAEESARQAALVEFNSKENRELRKRLAARGIRG